MKKLFIILITFTLILSFAACSSQEAPADSDRQEAADMQESEDTQTAEDVSGPFNENDMIFVYNGVSYPISTEAQPLLDVFGSDYEEITAPSCSFDGEDKQFIYDFATVYTYPVDGVDLLNEIYVYDGDFTTNRGISLGDTLDDVIEAYGEGGFEDGTSYVYALSGDPEDMQSQRLYFELTDGVVSGISYYGANGITL